MATDAKELERVRRIHHWLDYLAKTGVADSGADINDGEKHHSYTAAEVRAWPETKARIVSTFEKCANSRALCLLPGGGIGEILVGYDVCVDPVARGLCMYREQLSDALSPVRALTANGIVRINEEQVEALRKPVIYFDSTNCGSVARPKVDPYNPDGLKPEVRLEFEKGRRVAMDSDDVRSGRREKLVAALAAELSKPVTPRFPAEGRSDRALSVTNGMIRGRE